MINYEEDPFEGVDLDDEAAVAAAEARFLAKVKAAQPPMPKDPVEARMVFANQQEAYKQHMKARGIDFDDLEGSLARREGEILARLRATA